MLQTMLEYRKGILFVRLIGSLNKNTYSDFKKNVLNIIEENDIKNVVLNFTYLEEIDYKGISLIYYLYEISKNGHVLVCNINDKIDLKLKKNRVFNYIKKMDNEMEAFNLMKV